MADQLSDMVDHMSSLLMKSLVFTLYIIFFTDYHLTVESILSNVHYYRCHDYIELLATVHLLPEFIKQHPKVGIYFIHRVIHSVCDLIP